MEINLTGKVSLITGSTRGIGRAIAEKLAQAGSKVIVTGTSREKAESVAGEISEKYSVDAFGVEMNLSDEESEGRGHRHTRK